MGPLKTAFFLSDSTTRAIKVEMAVRDTCDRFIINLFLRHLKMLLSAPGGRRTVAAQPFA
jgi:hypothetical protein